MTGHVVPLDAIEEPSLREFSDLQRAVFRSACILIASVRKRAFDSLPEMHRAHFDWLVGDQLAKRVRGGPFGL